MTDSLAVPQRSATHSKSISFSKQGQTQAQDSQLLFASQIDPGQLLNESEDYKDLLDTRHQKEPVFPIGQSDQGDHTFANRKQNQSIGDSPFLGPYR